jgi:cellobiose-specific phosphotransferase system component IIC
MQPAPTPIQPEGFLDGLRWGCILRGALLDIALTVAGSIPLTLWLAGPGALSEDETTAREALDALSSPEALFWGAVLGIAATIVGAYYGAHRAGTLHVRHGGWVAVVSIVLGLPFMLLSAAETSAAQPSWYEAIGMIAMLPAGMLGGFLASMRGDAVA